MSPIRDPLVPMPGYGHPPALPTVYALGSAEPPEASDLFAPSQIFRWIRRRLGTLVLCAAAGLCLAVLAAVVQKPIYRAHVTLEIDAPNQNFLNLKAVDPTGDDTVSEPYIQTQIKKLQSESVLDGVAQRLHLTERPEFGAKPEGVLSHPEGASTKIPLSRLINDRVVRTLTQNLNVRPGGGVSRLVEVTYDSSDPQLAADIANGVGEELIRQSYDRRLKVNRQTAAALGGQLRDLRATLERSERQLLEYAGAAGLAQTADNRSLAEEKLRQTQETLSKAEEGRVLQQSKYERLKSSPVDSLPEVLDDNTLRNYQVKLTDLRREDAELRTLVTPEHYKLKQVRAQIAEVEAALERERTNVLGRIKNDYEASKQREQLLRQAYSSQNSVVFSQAGRLVRFSMLKREVDTNRQVYEAMLQRVKEVGIASEIPTSYMQIIDAAKAPAYPAKPSFPLYAAAGLLTGTFFGVGLVLLSNRSATPIEAPGDASLRLRLPELGVIPDAIDHAEYRGVGDGVYGPGRSWGVLRRGPVAIEAGEDSRNELALISWRKKNSIIAESFRATLASVLFSGQNGRRPHTVVITSACPGEGKTVVASNFGIALAKTNHRVLLVDGDLRRPRVHRIFNIPNDRGLSDLLCESTPMAQYAADDLAVATQIPGLYIMPSGSATASIPNLIYSARASALLGRLREEFDSVLIDSPPLSLADARGLGRLADGVILVVRADRTSSEVALAALRRLADDGTCVLGTVLNSWNPKKTSIYSYTPHAYGDDDRSY